MQITLKNLDENKKYEDIISILQQS